MTTTTAKVLIVEDHPMVCDGLKWMISQEVDFEVCGETGSVRRAQELLREKSPDIAIVDLSLEDGNGLDLIGRLKRRSPDIKILVYSMHDELLFAERTIKAGAQGYINKHEPGEHVIKALRVILGGKMYLSPYLVDNIVHRSASNCSNPLTSIDSLSDRELQVFLLIGQGCSNSAIAKQLNISVKTVDTHREKIKRKLGLTSAGQVIRAAVQWEMEQYQGDPLRSHTETNSGSLGD